MQQTNQTVLTPSRDSSGAVLAALKAAFPQTIPVLTGYFVLGLGYGIYVQSLGLPIWLPPLMGTVVYGGSLEFVLASLLLGSFSPLSAFLMALMIQARHLFYGLTMLERYQGYGLRGFYMIYAMSDETFSITCSAEPPEGVDRGWFMFFITLLDQIYWVASAFLGAAVGSILPFSTEGVDFVMTAMFVVIFLNQWDKEKQHYSGLLFFHFVHCLLHCLISINIFCDFDNTLNRNRNVSTYSGNNYKFPGNRLGTNRKNVYIQIFWILKIRCQCNTKIL